MNLIYDEKQVRTFFDTIYPKVWKESEVALVTLTSRSKYMEVPLLLGRGQEMIDRAVIRRRSIDYFLSKIYSFNSDNAYRDAAGTIIPANTMAYYVGLHLSDTISAWKRLQEQMVLLNVELASHAYNGGKNLKHTSWQLTHIDSMWYSSLQEAWTHRIWIDYDIDIEDNKDVDKAYSLSTELFKDIGITDYLAIHTRGGLHFLINSKTSTFDRDINREIARREAKRCLKRGQTEQKRTYSSTWDYARRKACIVSMTEKKGKCQKIL